MNDYNNLYLNTQFDKKINLPTTYTLKNNNKYNYPIYTSNKYIVRYLEIIFIIIFIFSCIFNTYFIYKKSGLSYGFLYIILFIIFTLSLYLFLYKNKLNNIKKIILICYIIFMIIVIIIICFYPPSIEIAQVNSGQSGSGTETNLYPGQLPNDNNFNNDILTQLNIRRCMNGVPPFIWDNSLQQNAQSWANKIQQQSNCNITDFANANNGSPHGPMSVLASEGQTIASITAPICSPDSTDPNCNTASVVTGLWYNEYYPGVDLTQFNENVGHYTQLVWKNTTNVGCGMVSCNNNDGTSTRTVVCNFSPPGNIDDPYDYSLNVNTPIKTYDQCINND